MKFKFKRYRVVKDYYAGYECQVWRLWFPFWVQMSGKHYMINTFGSIQDAEDFIDLKKQNNVIKYVE